MRCGNRTIVVGFLALVACSGSDDRRDPLAADAATAVTCTGEASAAAVDRIDATLHLDVHNRSGRSFAPPARLTTLVLALDVAGDGSVTGSLASPGPFTSLVAVTGRLAGRCLTLDAGELSPAANTKLSWSALSIGVSAAGLVVGGKGTAAGAWYELAGDVLYGDDYTADITASLDTTGEPLGLYSTANHPRDRILPTDVLSVALGEPANAASAPQIRLLANAVLVATPLPARVPPTAGLMTSVEFRGPAFWPFDATLSVDPGALADPSGNPLPVASLPAVRTVSDPGPLTADPSFERGLEGWSTIGTVERAGTVFGVAPVDGVTQVLVQRQSALAGYFDVAADATSFSVSVAASSETGIFVADSSAVVALHRASGERIVVFDAYAERARNAPCECDDRFGTRIPPTTKTVDLAPYRGERLFLTAETRLLVMDEGTLRTNALVLDDLRLQ